MFAVDQLVLAVQLGVSWSLGPGALLGKFEV
jgi:hypothetical protein